MLVGILLAFVCQWGLGVKEGKKRGRRRREGKQRKKKKEKTDET